ncbi:ribonuclease Z [Candidatus Woesearchaeota archaeon]|nr:ribonuclease Z [Candidatus Woesearchaeota archaeon]
MQITFLGTSCMVPTKERNLSSLLIEYKGEGILFDCGEGTQRQLKIAGIPVTKVTKILISHWHGDHVLGLPGLIQTLGSSDYGHTLEIYGPEGTLEHIKGMFEFVAFDIRVDMKVKEVLSGIFFECKDFVLESQPLKHPVPCVGYAFIEKDRRRIDVDKIAKLGIPHGPLLGDLQDGKTIDWKGKSLPPDEATYVVKGKKIALITDTLIVETCEKLAKDADLLVMESSYASDLKDMADARGHITALDAARLAARAGVKKLLLTHFSARYKNSLPLEQDARTAFDNVLAAKDLLRITV